MWDLNLINAVNKGQQIEFTYKSSLEGAPKYVENVSFRCFMNEARYFIIENASASSFAAYERVWVIENIINRPHCMRVTFYSLMPPVYHNMRNGGQYLLKSIAALRN